MKSIALKIATCVTPILLLSGCASSGATSTTNTALGTLSSLGGLVGLGSTPAVTTNTGTIGTGTLGTATGMGSSILKAAINQQCQTQLQNNSYWKIASVAMGADRQTQVANNVCGCVTEKAPQSVTINDMATAALDPNARTQIVGTAVARTMQSCYSQFVQ